MTLSEFAHRLQPRIDRFFDRKVAEYGSSTLDPLLSELFSYPKLLLSAGGKRVRPYVAAAAFEAAGGTLTDDVLDVLIGLELFHLFALIHDDVIDRGVTRHGVPTTHVFAERSMQESRRLGDIQHVAAGQAILVGDLVFSWAVEAMCKARMVEGADAALVSDRFHQMVDEVVVGQMIDVDLMTRDQTSHAVLERKMLLKTASYTFIRPMQIGIALAGGDGKLEAFADRFGKAIGIAYQIQDDYLDIAGFDGEKKPSFSDLADRQHTLFTQHIFTQGTAQQKHALLALFGKMIEPASYDEVRALFTDSGALASGTARMRTLFKEAHEALAQAALPDHVRADLEDMVTRIESRTP